MSTTTPRGHLRHALLQIGGHTNASAEDIRTDCGIALREVAEGTPAESFGVDLVTVGFHTADWGTSLELHLPDGGVPLSELLWIADDCALPSQVRRSHPSLDQDDWEAALLVSKLILSALASEPARMSDGTPSTPEDVRRPARSAARARFCDALAAISERTGRHPDKLTADLRAALLDFASATPDNQDAAQRIAVAVTAHPWRRAGICLSHSGHALGQVLLSAAGCPIPPKTLDALPNLAQSEWNAALRVTGLILSAFESEPIGTPGRPGAAAHTTDRPVRPRG